MLIKHMLAGDFKILKKEFKVWTFDEMLTFAPPAVKEVLGAVAFELLDLHGGLWLDQLNDSLIPGFRLMWHTHECMRIFWKSPRIYESHDYKFNDLIKSGGSSIDFIDLTNADLFEFWLYNCKSLINWFVDYLNKRQK